LVINREGCQEKGIRQATVEVRMYNLYIEVLIYQLILGM